MKKPRKGTSRSRLDASSWAALLAAREKSGLSVKEFCATEGISAASYYRWRKLSQEESGVLFSPIELASSPVMGLVVDLPGGLSLHFSELPPVGYLRSLSESFSGGEI